MPRNKKIQRSQVVESIRRELSKGPCTSRQVCEAIGISQPVFSRLTGAIGNDLLIVGKASKTQYALKREIETLGNRIPIYQIDSKGNSSAFGELFAVHPRGFFFESSYETRFYDDLPYFLNDLRPSGFIGRLIPRLHPEWKLPEDITTWSTSTCLEYIGQHGYDLIGNLIIGDPAFQLYIKKYKNISSEVQKERRSERYEKIANDLLALGDPGSSAGGEQAKFLTSVGKPVKFVLVKFSPPFDEGKIAQRRSDLLVCEHLAQKTLRDFDKNASASQIVHGKSRTFLEVERFDRVPPRGRVGVISLQSIALEFADGTKAWTEVANMLLQQERITKKMYDEIRFFDLFGKLIANTDMHLGNISFFMKDLQLTGLTPVYDMLPMLYAPQNEQIVHRDFIPPSPSPADKDIWEASWKLACEFWKRVSKEDAISKEFRKIAESNLALVKDLSDSLSMLPKN